MRIKMMSFSSRLLFRRWPVQIRNKRSPISAWDSSLVSPPPTTTATYHTTQRDSKLAIPWTQYSNNNPMKIWFIRHVASQRAEGKSFCGRVCPSLMIFDSKRKCLVVYRSLSPEMILIALRNVLVIDCCAWFSFQPTRCQNDSERKKE